MQCYQFAHVGLPGKSVMESNASQVVFSSCCNGLIACFAAAFVQVLRLR
jgi:hypothetical protein